jgi:hypothetical protein
MSVSSILSLNKPMGPCLIKALYWIALVIILLGVLHGVGRGVWIMTHQMPHQPPAVAQSSSTSSSTPNAMSPGSAPDARQTMWHRHFGSGYDNRGFRGPGFRHFRPGGFMMIGHLPPPVRGGLSILLSLFRGLVMVMVVRILAEIGNAILAMNGKKA